jgi:hypothetical protein
MMENEAACKMFPSDAIKRAREFLTAIGSTGAYTDSQGASIFREQIAEVSLFEGFVGFVCAFDECLVFVT